MVHEGAWYLNVHSIRDMWGVWVLDLQACMRVHIFLMHQIPVVPSHVLADPKLTHLCPAGPGRQATRRVPCARLSVSIGSMEGHSGNAYCL